MFNQEIVSLGKKASYVLVRNCLTEKGLHFNYTKFEVTKAVLQRRF